MLLRASAGCEGIRAAPLQRVSRLPSLSRREHHEGRTWREATVVHPTSKSCVDHVCTRVQVNCSDWSTHRDTNSCPRQGTWLPHTLLLVDHFWYNLCCDGSWLLRPPQWCFPVHPCVGGIFLLSEPWTNTSCRSHCSNVLLSWVFISTHIPNGTHGINVKICMEITWKTGRGKFLPLVEGNKVRLMFVALFQTEATAVRDDCAPPYVQWFIPSFSLEISWLLDFLWGYFNLLPLLTEAECQKRSTYQKP